MPHSVLAQMLGTYILESRQDLQINQKNLARLIGCSEQFLGRIEKGDVMIPDRLLASCIAQLDLKYEKIKKMYRITSDQNVDALFKQSAKSKKVV